ncbi:hypothetical protein GCM10009841_17420 [Microlunatus panaciterrae]|uniref:Murein DD-endopeptidase MepM/ murein hydrolase activator NlpD n=1 Tax=Microlunatus panaciterrae TaxID=400768 RepID=A0ABS2RMT3_9ACTN|nr:peptidoglycan DD-metalloendopeptidase family protein [Microlunatus panaciterrae]MBM7800301.1 murein DD-endopeptidase MepM/ murein hydrolase activator NlpD [Microlunatus panaciterrae]
MSVRPPATPAGRLPGGLLISLLLALMTWLHPVPALAEPLLPPPAGWPLAGRPQVLRGFDPPTSRWGPGHRGVDLAADVGDPVLAAAAGTVTFAGRVAGRGVVVVDHGAARTTYEPVAPLLPVGARVRAQTALGVLTTGDHCLLRSCLHWGLIRDGSYLDPLALVGPVRVRLLPRSAVGEAQRRAVQRAVLAAAAPAAAAADLVPAGRHGFSLPVAGAVTSRYGMRRHPVTGIWKLHDGTDFAAGCGTPIRAAADGRVSQVSANPGYGNRLLLDHGSVDGRRVVTGYNHALRYTVGVGVTVRRGQLIGYVGSTGWSTGCHLHLMLWLDGALTDPLLWF